MPLNFRQMDAGDLPDAFSVRLSTLENRVTLAELEKEYGITHASLELAMQTTVRGWLCEESGTVAGFAMGDGEQGEVIVIAVRPEHEGHGIGAGLLELVEEWLFSQGHEEIWLRSNRDSATRAHGFYRRRGWEPRGAVNEEEEILVLRRPRP